MARILIVEDEEKIARFVTLELEHEGYQVEHAADGRTAVDLALERDYDLILLDVLLPQLNGMEVLRRVRKHKDVPVIMVTARDAVMDKVAGLDAGADDYLTKPFAIEELFARIRVALKRAEAVRTASGVFKIENSIKAEDFINAEKKQSLLIPADNAVDFPVIVLNEEQTKRLFNGLYDEYDYSDGVYRVYSPQGFYGVGEVKNGKIKVKAYVGDYENL